MAIVTVSGTWIYQDDNGNDLKEPYLLLDTGRKVLSHQAVSVDHRADPSEVASEIATLLPQLKPNETTLIMVEDGSDQYTFAVVDTTRVSTAP